MKEKERAPKKEKPTKREKEILKKSEAERRENRKSKGITAIITIVVVLLLIGISTVVGLVVKDTPDDNNSSDALANETHNWWWRQRLIENYDGTIDYITKQGYVSGTDFFTEYDVNKAEENNGLIGSITMTDERGFFEIYYFGEASSENTEASTQANRNANTYYFNNLKSRIDADSTLNGGCLGSFCYIYRGDIFDKGVFK